MDNAQNPALAYALDLWADWMRNDFAEIRPLWYPSHSMVLETRQAVTEDTDCETHSSLEQRTAIEVNNAVRNLTPSQRGALERSLGLCKEIGYAISVMERLSPAYYAYLENKISRDEGADLITVSPRRVTDKLVIEEALLMYEDDLEEAHDKVWRHMLSMGCI